MRTSGSEATPCDAVPPLARLLRTTGTLDAVIDRIVPRGLTLATPVRGKQ